MNVFIFFCFSLLLYFFLRRDKDESITKYFPRAVKVCVEGAGHLIHQDHPDAFMKELLKFIA